MEKYTSIQTFNTIYVCMPKRKLSPEQTIKQRKLALEWYYKNKKYVAKRLKAKRLEQRPDYLRKKISKLQEELERLTT